MADASSLPTCRRSEEHTSELQSHSDIVCRLLLEKTWVTVVPMRTPVKAPGPRPKAMAASAFNDRSAARRRSSTMVRIRSAFFFNDTATPEIYTLSLHDALPISGLPGPPGGEVAQIGLLVGEDPAGLEAGDRKSPRLNSSHTVSSYAVVCLE